uniref:Uncharacterized protein n=1 Tax=Panagrolaimus sp. ES5 TaxID=591445 RepID=A0AC34GNB0_9BILA
MATKGDCPKFIGDTTTGNQYANLNLNQNYRHGCKESFGSKSVTADSRKVTNYGKKAVPKLSNFDNSHAKKDLSSWNKSNKCLSSRFLDLDCGIPGEKDEIKEAKDSSINNSSTLSLNIASYEATNDILNNENECLEKKGAKSAFSKTCTNAKQLFAGSPSLNQNIFEFPRQQENEDVSTPETAQFKASQKLLNPNTMHQDIANAAPMNIDPPMINTTTRITAAATINTSAMINSSQSSVG